MTSDSEDSAAAQENDAGSSAQSPEPGATGDISSASQPSTSKAAVSEPIH